MFTPNAARGMSDAVLARPTPQMTLIRLQSNLIEYTYPSVKTVRKSDAQLSFCRQLILSFVRDLTRAGFRGGGVNVTQLPYFIDSSKTTADIDAKLPVPYPASI